MRTAPLLRTLAAIAVLAPGVALAQFRRELPSAAECAAWARGLAAGGREALEALDTGWLAGCPSSGPTALASALRGARAETDTAYLARLAGAAGNLEHPAVLSAALDLAADRGASIPARATALLILPGQVGAGPGVNGLPVGTLLTQELPAAGLCGPGLRTPHAAAPAAAARPADAPRRMAVIVDRIRTDPTEAELLRNLARCVRPVVKGVPPQVDVHGVRLSYVCGNWFRVSNPTPETLTFAYVAERIGERLGVSVPARGENSIATTAPSSVRLYYDGRLIQTAENRGTSCPK